MVVVSNALTDITPFGRRMQAEAGYPHVAGGIEHGLTAIGAAVRWFRAYRAAAAPPAAYAPAGIRGTEAPGLEAPGSSPLESRP